MSTSTNAGTATSCPACGTWECNECRARRHYASRFAARPHLCPRCSSPDGQMLATRHRNGRAEDHRERFARALSDGARLRYPLSLAHAADA